jgi:hypothetical protein
VTLYFSYGSNMNQENMNRFCDLKRRPRIDLQLRNPRKGTLYEYKLDFNYHSTLMGGGAGNLTPSAGEHVEGVVYDMNEDDMITLDMKEGLPSAYKRIMVSIGLDESKELRNVTAYVACDDRIVPFSPPTQAYKQDLIQGAKANGLSNEWIAILCDLPTQEERR